MKNKLFVGALICAGIVAGFTYPVQSDQRIEYRYTVEPGDTVWSIACMAATKKDDVREIAYTISSENHIKNAHIYPGQELIIHVRPAE